VLVFPKSLFSSLEDNDELLVRLLPKNQVNLDIRATRKLS
jgi:hypothetical protein